MIPGGLKPTRNLGVQLTLFQPEGTEYAHHITACPPGFENLTASLIVGLMHLIQYHYISNCSRFVLSLQRLLPETVKIALFYSTTFWILSSEQIDI